MWHATVRSKHFTGGCPLPPDYDDGDVLFHGGANRGQPHYGISSFEGVDILNHNYNYVCAFVSSLEASL